MSDVDLVKVLVLATYKYASRNINSKRDARTYLKAMKACYYACSSRGDDLKHVKFALEEMKSKLPKRFLFNPLSRSANRYYMLAVEHTLDAINSIYMRFDAGYMSSDEQFVRNVLGEDYEG